MSTIRSLAFPFQQGAASFPRAANDNEAIDASIIQILTTGKKERVMRPTFGCDAFALVFESDTDLFRLDVEREVRMSLTQWEPRISVDGVEVSANPVTEPGQLLITVLYTNLLTGVAGAVTVGSL